MKSLILYLLIGGFSIICTAEIAAQPILSKTASELRKTVSAHIAGQAKAQEAQEYHAARRIRLGDLDGDGDRDAAVQYTLEGAGGGNNFAQMLAVFINEKGRYKFAAEEVAGGKMSFYTSTLKSVAKRKITLATDSCPEPPQGMCKNPKKGIAVFFFRRGKLVKG